jgi:hypothetical protein
MEIYEYFINIFVAILILFVTYYFLNSIGLTSRNSSEICSSKIPPPKLDTDEQQTQNMDEYNKCIEEEEENIKIIDLKRNAIIGVIGLILLLNKYYFPQMKSDLSVGFGLSGLILALMSISQYFNYMPDFFKFILSLLILIFILSKYRK